MGGFVRQNQVAQQRAGGLELKIGLLELQVRASVKTAEPLGMWMEWIDLPEAQREQINELVERLAV